MNTFQDRVALVTGAAQGLGAQVAKELAEQGAKVAVLDLDESRTAAVVEEIRRNGGEAIGVGADVGVSEQAEAAVARAVEAFGGLHVLVNNAGITRDNLLFKMTDDDWDSVMHVHLRGTFAMTRAAQRSMVEQRYGRIVNLSSTAALGNRGQANYSAAKMGLQGFTRTVALELGPMGITANCVAPGYIDTEMTRAVAERMGVSLEERVAEYAARMPLRRVGQPGDIANAVLFFASERSSFVTGQVLYVDGGRWLV
ncbi:3-oxoacyl-ACP reductase FabG [Aeromicrobium choanae]|uniref:3-oxoacyl-[acyl-carrier-protein] reductase n=1 Tax=Aeromicrobium choanae TaxID=1736691 RepID=A0A1T4YWP6_9ACTN|nr:3-oxoacyl-ACP reductase FabG [Aeromicrobium choanae]SKB06156.1 3-oxoacyl-[acyl-carrier-protein] reductase [Aeromicrobium choanae]